MIAFVLLAAFAAVDACPKFWMIDASALPKAAGDYSITLKAESGNGKVSEVMTLLVPKGEDADFIRNRFAVALGRLPGWRVTELSPTVQVRAERGTPFRRTWFASDDGAVPHVWWEFVPRLYVEFDFATLPRAGKGRFKIEIAVRTADKTFDLEVPSESDRGGDPGSFCEFMAFYLNGSRWRVEVVDKTKMRVYGRVFNDTIIPVTEGKVESPDLTKEELPKARKSWKDG